jgi:hypothetical protein
MYVHEPVQDVRWAKSSSAPTSCSRVLCCRLVNDYNQEVTESHAGKVVERHWLCRPSLPRTHARSLSPPHARLFLAALRYEKNKHVFPMVRWEVFDREKRFDRYTAKDGRQGDRINFASTLPSATAAAAAGLMPAAFLSVKALDAKANPKSKLWDDEAWRRYGACLLCCAVGAGFVTIVCAAAQSTVCTDTVHTHIHVCMYVCCICL